MNVQLSHEVSEARRLTAGLRKDCEPGVRSKVAEQVHPRPEELQMVLEGGVLRQRYLSDGRRHTVAVYYRDDVVNLGYFTHRPFVRSDYLLALRGTVVGTVPSDKVASLRAATVSGVDGMTAMVFRELGIAEERLISHAQRSSIEAMAHFMCETLFRCVEPQGNYRIDRCALCITQETLASVLGISAVHVNRTLQELRRRGLADIVNSELIVHDYERLAELAEFDDGYLAPV